MTRSAVAPHRSASDRPSGFTNTPCIAGGRSLLRAVFGYGCDAGEVERVAKAPGANAYDRRPAERFPLSQCNHYV
jgi:hypothetical protein